MENPKYLFGNRILPECLGGNNAQGPVQVSRFWDSVTLQPHPLNTHRISNIVEGLIYHFIYYFDAICSEKSCAPHWWQL